ncbi:MAG: UbiA family prenyltransferase, partial [Halobacteria archaeon]|nr:UbiA family prenyltransferase [Halobacteria archaeon]
GTYYVQAAQILGQPLIITPPDGTVTTASFVASLSAGALTTAILVVNNIRDIETDREAGKRTLAVMIGYTASRVEYTALLVLAYLVPVWFWLQPRFNIVVLLPVLSLPYAALVARTVWKEKSGEPLNKALEQTGKLLTLYSVLFGIGMIA